ncbi:hypothetical protein ACFW96_24245 [Streptomyces gardneri]|uniref:hypothetical protein n=1 Tax=Streptomyces gardneri TaxID=66892 RepID=UPI0036A14827
MQLSYVYRVSKYDPVDRDDHGHYTGVEDVTSDHGRVEAAYLQAVQAFAAETGVDRLSVREPEVSAFAHFGVAAPRDGFGLGTLLPGGLAGFHDGAEVPLCAGLELVRLILRDSGAWCRLEVDGVFAVHVGWDQYVYIGSSRPCHDALARTRELGLFPEPLDVSPYNFAGRTIPPRLTPGSDGIGRVSGLLACPTTTSTNVGSATSAIAIRLPRGDLSCNDLEARVGDQCMTPVHGHQKQPLLLPAEAPSQVRW